MTLYDAPIGYDAPVPYDGVTVAPPSDHPAIFSGFVVDSRIVAFEGGSQPRERDVAFASFAITSTIRNPLRLATVPTPLALWPIQRQSHVMPALSADNPKYAPGDYPIQRADVGRRHVLVGGTDVTFLRDAPVSFEDYSSSVPFGPQTASVRLPQAKPWDVPGVGDLAPFRTDAGVEIVLVRPDDSVESVWEGHLAAVDDTVGPGRVEFLFHADGVFEQANHEGFDPPVFMDPVDPGHFVADVLNSVTHRRYNAIPRATTGLPKIVYRERGKTKWQVAQDVLSKMWTADERQWTISRVGRMSFRIQLKASTTAADWTVTKGAPGVEVSLVQDQSTRRDALYGYGVDPDGGTWGNWFFSGLTDFALPLYPRTLGSNIAVGVTDSETTTGQGVTDWQRQMRNLGYPVTVDGVMNSSDTQWVLRIQRARGITADGSLGPQTWAATFENPATTMDLTAIRLPLATLPEVEPNLYAANGAIAGKNPADDPSIIRHAAPEIYFPDMSKADARILAEKMLARDHIVGHTGTITLTTDQHEPGASRFDIREGDNVKVRGHRGDVVVQVASVAVSDLTVRLDVDSRARDAMSLLAILERNRDARRDIAARAALTKNQASQNDSRVVPYEAESGAGKYSRTVINGNSGLWTVRKIFVSQVGVAKIEFTTSPAAEIVLGLFNRPITANQLAALEPDPLASKSGWFDHVDTLKEKYGCMEVFGTPESPGGYAPRQKGEGPLTGKLVDSSSTLYGSRYGGFVWVAAFTSKTTWLEGRAFPADNTGS